MRVGVLILTLLCPCPAMADALSFQFWPDRDPDHAVSCRIGLDHQTLSVIEVLGQVKPGRVLRWPQRRGEEAAVLAALQALIAGDLASVDIYTSRLPAPPYVTLNWSAHVNNRPVSGLYVQTGLDLPPVLAALIDTVLPGGPCQSALK